jgi:hypothetical protein
MQKRKTSNQVLFALYFAFSAVYLEFVFRLVTVGNPGKPGFLYGALFVVAYSAIGYLLSSVTKKETINRRIAAVVLFVTSALYIVQFLIYKQFKQFYDINTMTGGAGDALTSYFAELLDLLNSCCKDYKASGNDMMRDSNWSWLPTDGVSCINELGFMEEINKKRRRVPWRKNTAKGQD